MRMNCYEVANFYFMITFFPFYEISDKLYPISGGNSDMTNDHYFINKPSGCASRSSMVNYLKLYLIHLNREIGTKKSCYIQIFRV